MPEHKSDDYKETAVQYYLVGNNTQEGTCKIFHCTPRSLMRWVNKYETDGTVKRKTRTYTAYKVKQKHIEFIIEEIEKKRTITVSELLANLQIEYPDFEISPAHLWRLIRDNNVTLKLKRVRHIPTHRFGKEVDINQQLKLFYDTIKKYALDDIICIDETSISSLQQRNRCYSRKGTRCVVKTQSQDVFKKYTGIFGITTKGVIGWNLYDKGGIDANRLEDFLVKNILAKHKDKLIILDNASSHRNEVIKKIVNENNKLLYSVPYQHFTNAIEGFFNVLKTGLHRKEGLKYEDLKHNIATVVSNIEEVKFRNIFKGAYERTYYTRRKPLKQIKKIYITD
jgi:transposase